MQPYRPLVGLMLGDVTGIGPEVAEHEADKQ